MVGIKHRSCGLCRRWGLARRVDLVGVELAGWQYQRRVGCLIVLWSLVLKLAAEDPSPKANYLSGILKPPSYTRCLCPCTFINSMHHTGGSIILHDPVVIMIRSVQFSSIQFSSIQFSSDQIRLTCSQAMVCNPPQIPAVNSFESPNLP